MHCGDNDTCSSSWTTSKKKSNSTGKCGTDKSLLHLQFREQAVNFSSFLKWGNGWGRIWWFGLDCCCGSVELSPCEKSAMTNSFTASFLSCPSRDGQLFPLQTWGSLCFYFIFPWHKISLKQLSLLLNYVLMIFFTEYFSFTHLPPILSTELWHCSPTAISS